MYCPSHFKEIDPQRLQALVEANPLGAIVRMAEQGMVADHIPLRYQADTTGNGRLIGHVAKNNLLWQVDSSQEVLVIFQGANGYISPNWYPSKAQDHKVVPTWNYAVLHVYGHLSAIHDPAQKLAIVTEATNWQEQPQAKPWQVADAPADYIEKMLNAIVGIEIQITRMEGKWKMSQNQSAENQRGAAEGLAALGAQNVVAVMRERLGVDS